MHADHFIWSSYGTWIPNCPRESWPRYIRSWERSRPELCETDDAIKSADPFGLNRRIAEKNRNFPPIRFSQLQMRAIAEGFQRCVHSRQAWVWACCIMPEYVQMLVTCPRTPATQLVGLMRCEATKRVHELGLHPMSEFSAEDGSTPIMWSHSKWHIQLKDDESIRAAIDYMQQLPERQGEVAQPCAFISPFESLERCREEVEAYHCDAA